MPILAIKGWQAKNFAFQSFFSKMSAFWRFMAGFALDLKGRHQR